MKNRIFVLLVIILSVNQLSIAINYNQKLMDVLLSGKYPDAELYYSQNKDSISDPIRLFYEAEMSKVLNQPHTAIEQYNNLIQKYFSSFPRTFMIQYVVIPLMYCYEETQQYQYAVQISKQYIELLKGDTTLTPYVKHLEKELIRLNQQMQQAQSYIIEIDPTKQPQIPLVSDFQRITFNAKWNGHQLKTLFDTGCPTSYFFNLSTAGKIGVRINYQDTLAGKIRYISGVLDSIELGNIKIKNIPVMIDTHKPDGTNYVEQKCDSVLNSMFDAVLGLDIIKRVGITDISFEKSQISFLAPTKWINSADTERNMYIRNKSLFLSLQANGKPMYVYFDTGSVDFTMSSDYYNKYKNHISVLDTMVENTGFIGGCESSTGMNTNQCLLPKHLLVDINNQQLDIRDKSFILFEAPKKETLSRIIDGNDGLMGTCLFEKAKSVVFDFNAMVLRIQNDPTDKRRIAQ